MKIRYFGHNPNGLKRCRDGVFTLAVAFSWLCLEVGERTSLASTLPLFDVPALMRHLPVEALDEAVGKGVLPPCRDYANYGFGDDYWKQINHRATLWWATTPILFTADWYDYYAGSRIGNK